MSSIRTKIEKLDNLPLWAQILIKELFLMEESVESLMNNVESNTVYRKKGKYVTPAGRYSTYTDGARANNITTYMLKKHLKDENNDNYYIDLDNTVNVPQP